MDRGEELQMSRSWLYNLQPIGIRTSSVESLTGYISRLALAHCVYVRDLLIHGLLPIFGRGYLIDGSDHNQSAFWKDTPALNSVNTSTRDWTQLLIRFDEPTTTALFNPVTLVQCSVPSGPDAQNESVVSVLLRRMARKRFGSV